MPLRRLTTALDTPHKLCADHQVIGSQVSWHHALNGRCSHRLGRCGSPRLSGCCVSNPTPRSRTGSRGAMSRGVNWRRWGQPVSSLTPGSVTSKRIASPSASFSPVCGCTWLAGRTRRATASTHYGTEPSPVCTATPREAPSRGFPRVFSLARRSVSLIGSTCSFAATLMTWVIGVPQTLRRVHPETRSFQRRIFCGQRTTGGSLRRMWTPTSPGWAGPKSSSTR